MSLKFNICGIKFDDFDRLMKIATCKHQSNQIRIFFYIAHSKADSIKLSLPCLAGKTNKQEKPKSVFPIRVFTATEVTCQSKTVIGCHFIRTAAYQEIR